MKQITTRWATLAASIFVAGVMNSSSHAQSVDALLKKLVDKKILTEAEAKDLKADTDKDFAKAYQGKSALPGWVTSLKFNGDFRGRYEGFYADTPPFADRHRFRYRLRFGATAVLQDQLEFGLRLSSGEPAAGGDTGFGGDPISPNTSLQNNGSRKFVYLDLAYGKWTPINSPTLVNSWTIGKMENPFVYSDMVFDHDYTPEGIGSQLTYNINKEQAVKLNLGGFVIDELAGSSRDPFILGAQIRFESKWSDQLATSLGLGALMLDHEDKLNASSTFGVNATGGVTTNQVWTVPNQNFGNSRNGTVLANNFNPLIADASVTYSITGVPCYTGAFPIKLGGEFMHNPAAASANSAWSAGLTFGKAGKKRTWELGYRYKYLEGDAWYEELTDSDFGALYRATSSRTTGGSAGYLAGTNIKGHVVKGAYAFTDSFSLALTWFRTDTIQANPDTLGNRDGTMNRVQLDALWKF